MIARLIGRWRRYQLDPWRQSGDIPAFADVIAGYRKRGATIGARVRMLGRIDGVNPHLVRIGSYCVLGAQSALLAHCPIKGAAPCIVGDFVYIAFGAIVMPGVTVGDCTVVGAGAIVTRDVPSGHVVAGNPARVLRPMSEREQQALRDRFLGDRFFGRDDAIT